MCPNVATLDVVTTALQRPDLLEITYGSFFRRIRNLPPRRIILNIDPIGDGDPDECVAIAKQYSNQVIWRLSEKPDFMGAVLWSYSQVTSDLVLHLEDDWLLKRDIDFSKWLSHLRSGDSDQSVLLMGKPRTRHPDYYSFRPHLAKPKRVLRALASLSDPGANPEKALIDHPMRLTSADYVFAGNYTVEDIGRKWAKCKGFKKSGEAEQWFVSRPKSMFAWIDYRLSRAFWKWRAL